MADNNTYITTKAVAQILNISEPSVRLHAQRMEKLGYTFSKWQNARQFKEQDVRLIGEVLKMNSETKHDLNTCFRYFIKKDSEGQTAADELLEETRPIVQRTEFLTKENEVYKDLKQDNQQIMDILNTLKESAGTQNNNDETIDELKLEIDRLESELKAIKDMNYFDFRKWKKK